MGDCEEYREQISLLLDGELTAEQEASLRTHIETCAGCRKVYEAFSSLSQAVSEDMIEPPEMLAKGVMFKIRNPKKHRRFAYGKFTALAACLAVILFGAARFGYLGGANPSGNAAQTENTLGMSTYGAESGGGTQGTDSQAAAQGHSREDIKKGIKLETSEDGTVYQLGFPIQNFELLSGAKPEEVKKEPVCLLNAEKLTVYEGEWHADEEFSDRDGGADGVKNARVTDVSDEAALEELGVLLTSVPDDTSGLSVESKELSDGDPAYTLYIPARKQSDAEDAETEDTKAAENKAGTFKNSLDSLKNNFLKKNGDSEKKTDDGAKAASSPPVSGDGRADGTTTQELMYERDVTIRIWYVNGEIWCAMELAEETDPTSSGPSPKTDAGRDETETASPEVSPAATDNANKTSESAPDVTTEETDGKPFRRILYKAAGTPEKLDALMEKLAGAGKSMLTEDNTKK